MGRVEYGAKVIRKEGKEAWIPEIIITMDGVPDLVFTSNLAFEDPKEVETFAHHVYKILSGPKTNVQVYQQGTHGSGHLN